MVTHQLINIFYSSGVKEIQDIILSQKNKFRKIAWRCPGPKEINYSDFEKNGTFFRGE